MKWLRMTDDALGTFSGPLIEGPDCFKSIYIVKGAGPTWWWWWWWGGGGLSGPGELKSTPAAESQKAQDLER